MAATCADEPQGRFSGVSREGPSTAVLSETTDAHARPNGSARDARNLKKTAAHATIFHSAVAAP